MIVSSNAIELRAIGSENGMNELTPDKIPAKTNIETHPTKLANIESLIHTIRGKQFMIDSDLAVLYGVETKVFNQAVKRNEKRFSDHFRFRLTDEEYASLRSQLVTSRERGGRRCLPCHAKTFHDRFLVPDKSIAYHIGASLKDAGKKCFAINLVQDDKLVSQLIDRIAGQK